MKEAANSSSHLQQQQQQPAVAVSRFPSNTDAHLQSPGMALRRVQPGPVLNVPHQLLQQHHQQSRQQCLHQQWNPQRQHQQPQQQRLHQQWNLLQQHQLPQQQRPHQQWNLQQQHHALQRQNLQQPQQPQKKVLSQWNQLALHMAYQDARNICGPDFYSPFSSLGDACERLLPYHVIADYEAEEDDKILDSDPTGQVPSRSQQWDNNVLTKVEEFTSTFEKQALAFNIINRRRAAGGFRAEERLILEQALSREEKRAMLELRTEVKSWKRTRRDVQVVPL